MLEIVALHFIWYHFEFGRASFVEQCWREFSFSHLMFVLLLLFLLLLLLLLIVGSPLIRWKIAVGFSIILLIFQSFTVFFPISSLPLLFVTFFLIFWHDDRLWPQWHLIICAWNVVFPAISNIWFSCWLYLMHLQVKRPRPSTTPINSIQIAFTTALQTHDVAIEYNRIAGQNGFPAATDYHFL